jgi:ParB-like chromosome segregation protein Spo0J
MAAVGLFHPIMVTMTDDGRHVLNAGERRLRAAMALGWTTIEARIIEGLDETVVELASLDENIVRRDLQGAALDKALARRKVLYETLHPKTVQHMAGAAGKWDGDEERPKSFVEDTADKTGKSARTIERSVRRAERLSPRTIEAYGDGRLSKTQADILAALPHDEQETVLDDVVGKSVEETRQRVSGDLYPPEKTEEPDRTPMQLLEELYMHGQRVVGTLEALKELDEVDAEVIESVMNLAATLSEEFASFGDGWDEEAGGGSDAGVLDFPAEPPF